MTIQEFFEAVPESLNSDGYKSICGEDLVESKSHLNGVDAFKNCNIQILSMPEYVVNKKYIPVLTYKYIEGLEFNENVKLFSIFQSPDGWGFRATKDSVK